MIVIKEYKKAESLEEAWQLNQKKSNRVIGGMLWLKMAKRPVSTAIDLSGLGLDQIEETDEEFRIGCMTTLRDLEQHQGLQAYTDGAMKEALRHIVGVQFRNLATVGGSIYGRYGFSDVLTMFLAMDSYVELYKGGIVPLEEFSRQKKDRDILVAIRIKKEKASFYYQSVRNHAKTDFPVLTCAAAKKEDGFWRFSIGARPKQAVLFTEQGFLEKVQPENVEERAEQYAERVKQEIATESNIRGSAEYRTHLTGVLIKRAILHLASR